MQIYSNNKKRKVQFAMQLKEVINVDLLVTQETDILKYSKRIKDILVPYWLTEEEIAVYSSAHTELNVNRTEKTRVQKYVSKKWNGLLSICFDKVSLVFNLHL